MTTIVRTTTTSIVPAWMSWAPRVTLAWSAAYGGVRLWFATGHGPVGLQLGPYSGKVVAETIIDGAAETDIGRFGLARFAPLR